MSERFRITLTFEDKAVYSWIEDAADLSSDFHPGNWERPFPNEPGNSLAFGIVEVAEQSDFAGPLLAAHGDVIAVAVSRLKANG